MRPRTLGELRSWIKGPEASADNQELGAAVLAVIDSFPERFAGYGAPIDTAIEREMREFNPPV